MIKENIWSFISLTVVLLPFVMLTDPSLMLTSSASTINTKHENNSPEKTAPCFNDSGEDGSFGVWIYEGFSRWEEARDNPKAPVLTFGFKPGMKKYSIADLDYCFFMVVEDLSSLLQSFSKCKSGSVIITHINTRNALHGSHKFVLENGQEKAGIFEAPYCPPKEEMPKK